MVEIGWMALGGFLGAIARYAVSTFIVRRWLRPLPMGTLLVNVAGSFLFGWFARSELNEPMGLFLGTGFMGAFTTFSTFKLEIWTLIRQGLGKIGHWYMGLTYALGIAAAWFGFWLGTTFS